MTRTHALVTMVVATVFVAACAAAAPPTQPSAGGGGAGTGGNLSGKGGTTSGGGALPAGPGTQPGTGGGTQPGGVGQPGQPAVGVATSLPAWLKVGVRLTWYSAAASVAQSRFAWVEDPNGGWEDPRTGKRYSRTDEGPGAVGQPGASGDGYSTVDVLAVEGTDVVLQNNLWVINRAVNPPVFTWSVGPGARVPGLAVDGAWLHPALLQQYNDQRLAGLLVLRGPYQVGNRTYDAVAFANPTPGASLNYVYDAQTGILLSSTSNTAGATSPFAAPGENPPVGNTQLTYTQFVALRERTLPGLGAESPQWVAGTRALRYGGAYNVTNPVDPTSGSLTSQIQFVAEFGQHHRTWSPYQARSVVQGQGGQAPVTGVTASTGLYWYDPGSLAGMQPGQVLDQDPILGQQTVVAQAGGGAGGNIVTIDTVTPGNLTRASYDLGSGTLVAFESQAAATGTTVQLQLQGN